MQRYGYDMKNDSGDNQSIKEEHSDTGYDVTRRKAQAGSESQEKVATSRSDAGSSTRQEERYRAAIDRIKQSDSRNIAIYNDTYNYNSDRRGGNKRLGMIWGKDNASREQNERQMETQARVADAINPLNRDKRQSVQALSKFSREIDQHFDSGFDKEEWQLGPKAMHDRGDFHRSWKRIELKSPEAREFADRIDYLQSKGFDQTISVEKVYNRDQWNNETKDSASSHVLVELSSHALKEFKESFSEGKNFKKSYFMSRSDYGKINVEYFSPRRHQHGSNTVADYTQGW